MDIKLVTQRWGYEISWTFGGCSSTQTFISYHTHDITCCQLAGNYQLTCLDSYGDGWHGGYLEIGGTQYCNDFTSGSQHPPVVVTWSGSTGKIIFLFVRRLFKL